MKQRHEKKKVPVGTRMCYSFNRLLKSFCSLKFFFSLNEKENYNAIYYIKLFSRKLTLKNEANKMNFFSSVGCYLMKCKEQTM